MSGSPFLSSLVLFPSTPSPCHPSVRKNKVRKSASQMVSSRMQLTLDAICPTPSRCFALGARDVCLVGENNTYSFRNIVGMRGSAAIIMHAGVANDCSVIRIHGVSFSAVLLDHLTTPLSLGPRCSDPRSDKPVWYCIGTLVKLAGGTAVVLYRYYCSVKLAGRMSVLSS